MSKLSKEEIDEILEEEDLSLTAEELGQDEEEEDYLQEIEDSWDE